MILSTIKPIQYNFVSISYRSNTGLIQLRKQAIIIWQEFFEMYRLFKMYRCCLASVKILNWCDQDTKVGWALGRHPLQSDELFVSVLSVQCDEVRFSWRERNA